ncbi:C40 family peptidase [Jatrophihabitans sp.]|uniref:C40 family peptidase n=1 Tax=Jatrophihabitans sp. TaxID=1932789 RepID=UPI0030C77489|nr:hypothetical protein [Jatrophihabitans sp.]
MANRLSRRVRLISALSAVCAAAVLIPAVASAAPQSAPSVKPKPTIAQVDKELAALAVQNTQLVEKYNQAQIAVTARQQAAAKAQAAEAAAKATVDEAGVELSRSALAQYEGGAFSAAGALLSSNGGTNYLDQLDTMQMISAHAAQVVSSFTTAQNAATAAKNKADELLASATKTRDELAAQRAKVKAQVKQYATLLATLTAAQRKAFQNSVNPQASKVQTQALQVTVPDITSAQVRKAVTFALAQVGKPYQWGAGGPGSYDCSGLTMASYRAAGISLPHSAAGQYNYGHHVAFSDLQPGDLLFFYRPIGHVTMYVGNGLMVSAPETGEDVKVIPATVFGSSYVGATRLVNS